MRQRTIFQNEEIIAKFLRKEKGYYRNKQDNLYHSDDVLYSYGTHYPIAKWVVNRKGQNVLLVNTTKSTRTTERQKRLLLSYIHSMDIKKNNIVMYVDMYLTDRDTVENMLQKIYSEIDKYKYCKPKDKEEIRQSIKERVTTLISYAELFGLKERYIRAEDKYTKLEEVLDKLRTIEKYDIDMYFIDNMVLAS